MFVYLIWGAMALINSNRPTPSHEDAVGTTQSRPLDFGIGAHHCMENVVHLWMILGTQS